MDLTEEFKFRKYYFSLEVVDSFQTIQNDSFLKLSFNKGFEETAKILKDINSLFGIELKAVTSGHGNIDVMLKEVNKSSALQFLLNRWGLSCDHLATFGDGGEEATINRPVERDSFSCAKDVMARYPFR